MTTIEEAPADLIQALARVQAAIPEVEKSRVGRVRSEKANYEYRYADLSEVSAAILPLLGQNGLAWVTQPTMTDHGFVLRYTLMHSSGQSISGEYPLPDPARIPAQQVGSALTYARRYCLCAVTGVAPGEDDDDAAAAQRWAEYPTEQPRRSRRRTGNAGPLTPPTVDTATEPDDDEPMTDGTQRRLMSMFSGAGFKNTAADRARRLRVCEIVVGHDVATAGDLTNGEARAIMTAFTEHRKDVPGWLAGLLGDRPAADENGAGEPAETAPESPDAR